MSRSQGLIFPGIIIGSLVLVLVTSLIAHPMEVVRASFSTATPAEPLAKNRRISAEIIAVKQPIPQPKGQPASSTKDCAISSTYPGAIQQWCPFITRDARAEGLDPNLVAAIMVQESSGDPGAYSTSGAVGLLQVMPRDGLAATFQCASGPCFANRPTIQQLSDPDFNLHFGTGMFAGLVRKYGNERDALFAYGPHDVGYTYADAVLAIYSANR